MNHYQKVLICIFRTLGVLVIAYTTMMIIPALQVGMGLVPIIPFLGMGIILYMAAVPLAKIITIGLKE